MNCNSNHSIFLRSNGTLACWDDGGSSKELQAFDEKLDYAKDVFLGSIYESIRTKLSSGDMPFPQHCSQCFCLMTHMPMDDGFYAKNRHIETFQIEPSMGCQLECPGCIPKVERRNRVRRTDQGQLTLATKVLYKIVDDLHRANFRVDKFDMQGHGEPLLNKNVWEMCNYISKRFPQSVVSICTHANFRFERFMIHSGVNEVFFAIDGVSQPSYVPYRKNGCFDTAYKFMHDFSRLAADEAPHINRVWKYVLFAHNDTEEHLLRAQELAIKAKISTIRFVTTQLGNASRRIINREDLPILDKSLNIYFDSYTIKPSQLDAAIDELNGSIRNEDWVGAENWADFLSYSVFRLFRTRPVNSSRYKDLILAFRNLLAELPASRFGRFDALVADTIQRLESSHQDNESAQDQPRQQDALRLPPRARDLTVKAARTALSKVIIDESWYLETYQDVRDAIARGEIRDAAEHFFRWGYYEDRLPCRPLVDNDFYLDMYPEVRRAYDAGDITSATEHFISIGYQEGRIAQKP